MALALLALICVAALALIPVGLPGTWLMLGAALLYDWFVPGRVFGLVSLGIVVAIALAAEVLEFTLASRWTDRAGGSSRAGWGALGGGLIGAFVGVPIFLVGSVIGAFVGAFLGAFAMEWSVRGDHAHAGRVASAALVGRAVATAAKLGAGVAIGAVVMLVAIRGA
jgi:uncharacterized protein YqgC (DUF456 family)